MSTTDHRERAADAALQDLLEEVNKDDLRALADYANAVADYIEIPLGSLPEEDTIAEDHAEVRRNLAGLMIHLGWRPPSGEISFGSENDYGRSSLWLYAMAMRNKLGGHGPIPVHYEQRWLDVADQAVELWQSEVNLSEWKARQS